MRNARLKDYFELMRATKHCDRCQNFGGWFPVAAAGETGTTMHFECLRPGFRKTLSGQKIRLCVLGNTRLILKD